MGTPGCLLPAPSASWGVYREPEPRHSCQHAALQPLRKAPKPTVLRVSTSSQQKQPWCRRKLKQQDQKHGWKLCASAADLADAWPPDSSHCENAGSEAGLSQPGSSEEPEPAGSRPDHGPPGTAPFAALSRLWRRLWSPHWQQALQVPWSGRKTFEIVLLWLAAYWTFSHALLPACVDWQGLDAEGNIAAALSSRQQALVHVVLDLGNLALTLFILWRSLREFQPRKNLSWFRPRWTGRLWHWAWLPLACPLLPLVEKAVVWSQELFPTGPEQWSMTIIEQSVTSGDPVAACLYFSMIVFCAPCWEELMFRGFLLPSLATFIPLPAAVLLSSFFFALIHFSVQRFLPLLLLGIIFGLVFVGSRNLAAPIALHALYNTYIFGRVVSWALGL